MQPSATAEQPSKTRGLNLLLPKPLDWGLGSRRLSLLKEMIMAKKYYLAYGSNLNLGQMLVRCPNAKVVGISEIPNYRLLFKGSKTGAYLTIEPCKGESVPVAIWQVTKEDEQALDHYEGYPNFYYKKELKVQKIGFQSRNEEINAFVYIMHEERQLGIPSKRYVKVCLEGYKAFSFNKQKLNDAYILSLENYCNER